MPNLARVRAIWSAGAVVGGGVSTFYFAEGASGFQAAVAELFDDIKASIPNTQQIFIPATGDLIDVGSGELTGSWTEGSGTNITGGDAAGYAAGVGLRVVWPTSSIVNGRRVRGSTFFCPIGKASFEGGSNLATATVTLYEGAANTFLTTVGTDFKIWTRPKAGSGGAASSVTSFEVPDQISWLISRRT